jgi:hypothetical protein
LIRAYAVKLQPKFAHEKDKHAFLREHLGRMGRLLLATCKVSQEPDATMKSFITPMTFSYLFDATKDIAVFDSKTHLKILSLH